MKLLPKTLFFWPGPSAEMCRGFLLYNFGGFCRGFSWRMFLGTFSPQNEEIKSGDKICEKIRRTKNKNPQKNPFCQKPTLIFHVAEMRFSEKIIPKQYFHVILRITNEYVKCNFWEKLITEKYFDVTQMYFFLEINLKKLCM